MLYLIKIFKIIIILFLFLDGKKLWNLNKLKNKHKTSRQVTDKNNRYKIKIK